MDEDPSSFKAVELTEPETEFLARLEGNVKNPVATFDLAMYYAWRLS